MSTAQLFLRSAAALLMLAGASRAGALELKSYKDRLFAYPTILDQADGGAFLKVDYSEKRDIDRRDEVPERRVKGSYVSLGVRWKQDFETVEAGGRAIDVFRAGTLADARFAVIFIHGRGGDRKLGANDFSFGGNFNRLKNLAVDNDGVYLAPSVRDFEDGGAADIAALISHVRQKAPQARIILSCASMGSFICWKLGNDAATVERLAGMMIMGGATDPAFEQSAAFAARLPMFFSHGSKDTVYAATEQMGLYRSLVSKGYPTRFVLFETGTHGTPIRMTDWRDSLNWLLK
jgi:hypothetical protein